MVADLSNVIFFFYLKLLIVQKFLNKFIMDSIDHLT